MSALSVTAARGALRRGLSFYVTLGIAAAILFAGNGLDASTVTRFVERSSFFSAALLGAWVLGTMPVARALLHSRDAQFIKGLAVPSGNIALVLALFLGIAEAPWALLWLRGQGLASGAAGLLVAAVLHATWLARPCFCKYDRGLRAALLGALAWTWVSLPRVLLTVALVPASLLAVRSAWLRDVNVGGSPSTSLVRGPPLVAAAAAHALSLVRAHAHVLARSISLVIAAMAMAYAVLLHRAPQHIDEIASVLHGVLAVAVVAASASVTGPMLRTERAAAWVFDATGFGPERREAAVVLVIGVGAALLSGAGATVVAGWLGAGLGDRALASLELAVAMGSLGALTERAVRWSVRGEGRDSARLLLSLALILALALVPLAASAHLATAALSALTLAVEAWSYRVRYASPARGAAS